MACPSSSGFSDRSIFMFVISITFPSLLKHPEEFVGLLHGEAHPVVFDVIDIFVNGALGASIND
jgi:hypothetical protein